MPRHKLGDVIVLLPGILGSVLRRDRKTCGPTAQWSGASTVDARAEAQGAAVGR